MQTFVLLAAPVDALSWLNLGVDFSLACDLSDQAFGFESLYRPSIGCHPSSSIQPSRTRQSNNRPCLSFVSFPFFYVRTCFLPVNSRTAANRPTTPRPAKMPMFRDRCITQQSTDTLTPMLVPCRLPQPDRLSLSYFLLFVCCYRFCS